MLKKRGEPIPLDMLVAADQLGLSLKVFDQPINPKRTWKETFHMTQNKKKMNFSTGSGIAQYPWLTKPDYAFDSNGQYKVNLKVPAKDAKDLMDEIKGIAKNEFGDKASSARMPWKTDAETGEIVIITKSSSSRRSSTVRVT